MKQIILIIQVIICNSVFCQSSLKEIVLNKNGEIPKDWVNIMQEKKEWIYQKTVSVKRKKDKDYEYSLTGKIWIFHPSTVDIFPYYQKIENKDYSEFQVNYHEENKTFVLITTIDSGDRTRSEKIVYRVINLTNEYLILEKIKYTYCFDFSTGRELSKEECEEKAKNEPERLFGGKQISINLGGKPAKLRYVFKANEYTRTPHIGYPYMPA
jgi:hypothetical protein